MSGVLAVRWCGPVRARGEGGWRKQSRGNQKRQILLEMKASLYHLEEYQDFNRTIFVSSLTNGLSSRGKGKIRIEHATEPEITLDTSAGGGRSPPALDY